MEQEALFELAARFGLDPEVVAEIAGVLRPDLPDDEGREGERREVPQPIELLGRGGVAEVWLAHDPRLERPVAMKVLRSERAGAPDARDRFLREARATARLVHPGIVPVHDVGVLPDGRPFFTMDVVVGDTLRDVLSAPSRDAGELHRRVELLRRAVETVAYAHDQGVLHRDLKPANVMVGPFGRVFVLDWGLIRGEPAASAALGLAPGWAGDETLPGSVKGTPGYLSPEQARGEAVGPPTDVFALGVVLWEILEDRRLFDPSRPRWSIEQAAIGVIPPCVRGPEPLRRIVERALAADPAARFPHAGGLAEALTAWLDGEARRAVADGLVVEAGALDRREQELRGRVAERAHEAERALRGVPAHAPVEAKREGWRLQDEAADLAARADHLLLQRLQALHGALTHDGAHPGALAALADHWHGRHRAAEARRDAAEAREAEAQLAFYDRGRHAAYLRGIGRLVVRTDPPGVAAVLWRFAEHERRLVAVEPRPLGPTPVTVDDLPLGSYVVRFDGSDAVLPVWIRRGIEVRPPPVRVRVRPEPGACFVPAGTFFRGAPTAAFQCLPWGEDHVDDFVIARDPVTHGEYIAFLDDLVRQGREDEALRCVPHERAGPDQPGRPCYTRARAGGFELAPDADGDVWDPRWPVFLVDHAQAEAYAAWLAARTGRPWRLPTELEWEKAARGVDGRAYPWGDRFDASFACVRASHPGRPLPARVDAFPADVSVYGVRGAAGNVRDWCSDPFVLAGGLPTETGEQKVLKGGCWYFPESGAHLAARYALDAHNRGDTVSFRVARSLAAGEGG